MGCGAHRLHGRGGAYFGARYFGKLNFSVWLRCKYEMLGKWQTHQIGWCNSLLHATRGLMRSHLFLFAALVLAGCDGSNCTSDCITVNGDGPMIHGSGNMRTEMRQVAPFAAVQIDSAHVTIERTGSNSLSVTGDDKLLPLFTTEVKDGTLHLSFVKGKTFEGKMPAYHVTVADLHTITLDGTGRVDASKLDAAALSLSVAGAGSIYAAGRADALDVSVKGAGSVDASNLQVKSAKVVLSGVGNAIVNASEILDATISGVGRLQYLGSPKVTSHVSGVGKIEQKR